MGTDVNAAALAQARERFRLPNLEFVYQNTGKLPFDDDSFDLAVVNHVYEHVADQGLLFAELPG